MPDELVRFAGENVLIFTAVERMPRRLRDLDEAEREVRRECVRSPRPDKVVRASTREVIHLNSGVLQ